jgi:hypothetical protein
MNDDFFTSANPDPPYILTTLKPKIIIAFMQTPGGKCDGRKKRQALDAQSS